MTKEAQIIKLNKQILQKLDFSKVIYFEDVAAGACGNAGGILIYVISNNEFVAFHTNYYDDAETHSMAGCIIDNNINDFICYYGGLGNQAYIRKGIELETNMDNSFFEYSYQDEKYIIRCSVLGVFDSICDVMDSPPIEFMKNNPVSLSCNINNTPVQQPFSSTPTNSKSVYPSSENQHLFREILSVIIKCPVVYVACFVLVGVGLYFQLGWWYWLIIILLFVGLFFFACFFCFVLYAGVCAMDYKYHDSDNYCYYKPFDDKFAFPIIVYRLNETIFNGMGILETPVITDTERNTAFEHRQQNGIGHAYKGNLESFDLGNDDQIINFFYSYRRLRITWIYNQVPIITEHFEIKDIRNLSVQEQDEIAQQMIKLIPENNMSVSK